MKTLHSFIILGFSLAALFSCSKSNLQTRDVAENTCTVSFCAVGNQSKTTVDGQKVKWNATGETISLFCFPYNKSGETYTYLGSYKYKKGSNPTVNEDGTKANFSVPIGQITDEANCFDYLIVYPFSNSNSSYNRNDEYGSNLRYNIPTEQTPGDDYDDAASIMVAKVLDRATQGGNLGDVVFSHAVAYANLTITDFNCGAETVSSVKFTATGKGIAGKQNYNYITGAFSDSESTPKESVTATISPASSASFSVHFNLAPTTFSTGDKFSVMISTDNNTYTKEITLTADQASNLRFAAGVRTNFTVSFSGVTADTKGDEYEQYTTEGTSIPEGDYIIYSNGGAMKGAISSNRFAYEAVTVNSNKITTKDVTIVWHISGLAGNYLLYNANANKYAAGTGVNNKGQLVSDSKNEMAIWSISNAAASATITNNYNKSKSVNYTLRRNGTSGFAAYLATTGTAPVLYKKVVK